MTSSLVGSEMCIRDRSRQRQCQGACSGVCQVRQARPTPCFVFWSSTEACLLYTSDAADDM
eukprot:9929442-Prorocentrum_lima.AAC.1